MAQVYVGVLRATIVVPGARTLKDRRRVVRSVIDRMRSRFHVSVHQLPGPNHPGRQDIVVTTGGNEHGVVEQCLRSIQGFLEMAPDSHLAGLDLEAFAWHAPHERSVSDYIEEDPGE